MSMVDAIIRLVSKLPPEGYAVIYSLVRAITNAPDPLRAAKRALAAATTKEAGTAAIDQALKRGRR